VTLAHEVLLVWIRIVVTPVRRCSTHDTTVDSVTT